MGCHGFHQPKRYEQRRHRQYHHFLNQTHQNLYHLKRRHRMPRRYYQLKVTRWPEVHFRLQSHLHHQC